MGDQATGFVYFIQADVVDLIKIGWTHLHPDRRLSQHRTSSPVPLRPLGIILSEPELERRLHSRFARLWSHGEWFRAGEFLLAYIEANARSWPQPGDHFLLPGWYRLPHLRPEEPPDDQARTCDQCLGEIPPQTSWYRYFSDRGASARICLGCALDGPNLIRCNILIRQKSWVDSASA